MIMRKLNYCGAAILILLSMTLAPGAQARDCSGKHAPDITGTHWLNSAPLRLADLRGKVVLVEFWTLGCSNCRHVEPYVKKWQQRYADQGLVVIGVHTPEFDYEKEPGRVRDYVRQHGIHHAVVLDNDFAIWNRYGNRYWPAMYLIDKKGSVCAVQIGEGNYEATERRIRALLAES